MRRYSQKHPAPPSPFSHLGESTPREAIPSLHATGLAGPPGLVEPESEVEELASEVLHDFGPVIGGGDVAGFEVRF